MVFQDNAIKEYLKNVYFITGTPCGGKTTISRELAKRHNLLVYDVDEQFSYHQKISNSTFQPSMNKVFKDADEFFGRTVEEYKEWLIYNIREQLDFVLLDLIRLSQNKTVLCDCHLTVEEAEKYTEASRIVFLIKEPSILIEDYCGRSDCSNAFDRSTIDYTYSLPKWRSKHPKSDAFFCNRSMVSFCSITLSVNRIICICCPSTLEANFLLYSVSCTHLIVRFFTTSFNFSISGSAFLSR